MNTARRLALTLAACALVLSPYCGRPLRAETGAQKGGGAPVAEKTKESAAAAPVPLVTAVDRIELTVLDLARSRAFFENVLGFRARQLAPDASALTAKLTGVREARALRLALELGHERVVLTQYLAPGPGRPVPRDTRGNDLWFQHLAIVVRDMDRAYAWLRVNDVAHVSSGPQTLPRWNRNAGGIRAFYFADPDGHPLEIIHFPKGKGHPRWQERPACELVPKERCLFLGIDHTAITVEDTERSLAFYRDQLGLRVAGESENYGPEQEQLNGVFGARLRITALRAAQGPGVELLEYLSPRGGRLAPSDARPNDLIHVRVVVRARDARAALVETKGALRAGATLDADTRAAFVRDPDGHAVLLEEAP